jgi:hypothetical protein
MNELERAVRILLSQTPSAPALGGLERRARHRRVRHWSTTVVVVLVISIAAVGVAGAIGHHGNTQHIAVSPTTSTTVDANATACALGFFQQEKAQLEGLEKQLNEQLTEETKPPPSPNAGATDAAHQAVLRELSDVDIWMLAVESDDGAAPDLSSSADSLSPDDPRCKSAPVPAAVAAEWCGESRFLDAQRVQLRMVEQQLNQQLTDELASHLPNAGATDAAHQAVLRELSGIEQRILQWDEIRPGPFTCPPAHEPTVLPPTDGPTVPPPAAETWCEESQFLDAQRIQLKTLEEQLNQQLTDQLATHSPDAGATDAAHQAVLREQSAVQQRILALEENRPRSDSYTCPPADAPTTTTVVPTP